MIRYPLTGLIILLMMSTCTHNAVNSELPIITGLSDTTISINDTVTFSVKAGDPDGIVAFYWQFSDDSLVLRDTTLSGTLIHVFPPYAATCKVTVWAIDGLGGTSADSAIVMVLADPPSVDVVSPEVVRLGMTTAVYYENLSAGRFGSIVSTQWSIGGFNSFEYENVCTVSIESPAVETDSFPCVLRIVDDDHNVVFDTCYIAFHTRLWENVGNKGELTGVATDVEMAMDEQGTPYVAFDDNRHDYGLSVCKFTGANWQFVGEQTVTPSVCGFSLAMYRSVPYLLYNDRSNNYDGTIKRFTGSTWETVASPVYSSQRVCGYHLTIDSRGQLFVPYVTSDNNRTAMVVTYTGNRWSKLGNTTLASSCWWYLEMAIASDSIIYAAYQNDNATMSVKRYDGSGWSFAGAQPVSEYEFNHVCMAVDKSNIPHLAYTGTSFSGTTVLKYENGQWYNLDRISLAGLPSWGTSIAIDSSNVPVIAFVKHSGTYKNLQVMVMKLDGTRWRRVGFPYVIKNIINVKLTVDNRNNYYLAHANQSDSTIVVKCYR